MACEHQPALARTERGNQVRLMRRLGQRQHFDPEAYPIEHVCQRIDDCAVALIERWHRAAYRGLSDQARDAVDTLHVRSHGVHLKTRTRMADTKPAQRSSTVRHSRWVSERA